VAMHVPGLINAVHGKSMLVSCPYVEVIGSLPLFLELKDSMGSERDGRKLTCTSCDVLTASIMVQVEFESPCRSGLKLAFTPFRKYHAGIGGISGCNGQQCQEVCEKRAEHLRSALE